MMYHKHHTGEGTAKVLSEATSKIKKMTYNKKRSLPRVSLFIILFAFIGVAVVLATHAATSSSSIKAESAMLASGTAINADSTASGGSYIAFGSASTGARTGQLNGVLWGASRLQQDWPIAQMTACGSTFNVTPPHDIQVCNGQLHEALNDNVTVAALTMYPKQPFDFNGRTGTIVFDVNNDTKGNHAAWPELWMSDKPVPSPFIHEETLQSNPRQGFGIRFAGCTDTSGAGTTCSRGQGAVGVDSAVIITNYVKK